MELNATLIKGQELLCNQEVELYMKGSNTEGIVFEKVFFISKII